MEILLRSGRSPREILLRSGRSPGLGPREILLIVMGDPPQAWEISWT
jgi:hypothetical protein